jgi:hypothetical protein
MPKFSNATKSQLSPRAQKRDLWTDTDEHAALHVEQGGSGSSLPFDSDTFPVEAEVRHTQDEIYSPETTVEMTQVDLDKEDLTLAAMELELEQEKADRGEL